MKKVPPSAAFPHRVRQGVYVAAQCRRARREDLAQRAEAAAGEVRSRGRAWEDTQDKTTQALALKHAADWDLDQCAQEIRFLMASAGRNATREAPYTRVWHSGVDYYTGAREADQLSVYSELASLLTTYLPEGDPILTQQLPRLQALLEEWQKALASSSDAQAQETQARLALDDAEGSFDAVLDSIYGTLFSELGRKGAERFFP